MVYLILRSVEVDTVDQLSQVLDVRRHYK